MTAPNEPKGGRVIAGKFRLEWPIGRGGMGTVWAAMHLQLDMPVAVKFMDPSAADADGRQRFEREARAIAQLRSPHVVQVLDHGVDGGMPYIVMELLEGEDLESRLRRVKKLPLPVATRIFTQSAKALRRAHDAGIVHRDLKPNNVFLARVDDEEIVKLLDFGVAKMTWTGALDPHNESTQQGLLLGSPCYMSPEQARGNKNVDHRSDLWSLAVILFRSITGERPFDAATIADLIIKICAEPPPVASRIAADLPPGTDEFFLRAFSHDPDQRYQSALEMASDFEALVRSHTPATEGIAGGRIVSGHQRTQTHAGLSSTAPGVPARTQSNPGFPAIPAPQRTQTNPAMRALSMSGQLVPADVGRRASFPSLPPYEPPQTTIVPQFPPPPVQASPVAAASASGSPATAAARLSYPGDPPAQDRFGSGVYPGPGRFPPPPVADADLYAQAAGGGASGDPAGYSAGYEPGYGSGDIEPAPLSPTKLMDRSPAPSEQEAPPGLGADPAAPSPYADGEAPYPAASPDAASPRAFNPDSTQSIGTTSNTLRERSPSGRQLVVWTTIAAMITAVLVVAIFIMARSRSLVGGSGAEAKPSGGGHVGAAPPSSLPQSTSTPPTTPTPASTDVAAPSGGAAAEPPPVGGAQGGVQPSVSASASAPDVQAVPFGIEEDAGAEPKAPAPTQGPRQPWSPSGKKPKPNFGY